ncbi:MAG: pyridoxamine 5'-phosphate oxidase family protein [Bacteroidales bacterium]|nr:pyridoxamine 5'-phosphate oxidase family protein [Bacteroidales bacterium]
MIDQKIIDFISKHHVLTLATSAGNQPYCCQCFYTYDQERNIFIVKTNEDTRHTQELMQNPRVAVSIVLETEEIGKIQGLQTTGEAIFYEGDRLKEATKTYLKRFPYAAVTSGKILAIEPDFMKLTDNRFGFGKKLIWDNKKEIK